jgi:hypothetical protein
VAVGHAQQPLRVSGRIYKRTLHASFPQETTTTKTRSTRTITNHAGRALPILVIFCMVNHLWEVSLSRANTYRDLDIKVISEISVIRTS